jgi:hypothetical protein
MPEESTVRVLDLGNFYSIYGIVTILVLILLIWYFVRSNMEKPKSCKSCACPSVRATTNAPMPKRASIRVSPTQVKSDVSATKNTQKEGFEGTAGFPIEDPEILAYMPEFDGSMEIEKIQLSDPNKPAPYNLYMGLYGDVPLGIYDVKDSIYKAEFDHSTGIYLPNSRTY